ncbi:hypothetical protein B5S28_g4958 [[Candida] boidinii]|uniref:Unnamed protein product n=1 Tax=Candida boidinii TaxID=5477 RepID=A0ACB5TUF4_CANBO|nr:hypothetical protein B5S28_g4958 [[Candida] boidinii]OWB64041.1 hypothetical protein B5S29_g5072 [[Candida] boidinii]OWB80831.1 hypothetical protein B5S32_g5138 [[Candida] boidinii]GME95659.1 unnamed protein product [[Candida] boidinii]GMF09015.1 unnamed protein product [[Candida] boidinii]
MNTEYQFQPEQNYQQSPQNYQQPPQNYQQPGQNYQQPLEYYQQSVQQNEQYSNSQQESKQEYQNDDQRSVSPHTKVFSSGNERYKIGVSANGVNREGNLDVHYCCVRCCIT